MILYFLDSCSLGKIKATWNKHNTAQRIPKTLKLPHMRLSTVPSFANNSQISIDRKDNKIASKPINEIKIMRRGVLDLTTGIGKELN